MNPTISLQILIADDDLENFKKVFNTLAEMNSKIQNTCLEKAAYLGAFHILEYLLTNPCNIRQLFMREYAFLNACEGGQLNIVEYLIRQGVNPTWNDHVGYVHACECEQHDVILFLLNLPPEQGICPEKTSYDIAWAMDKEHTSLVVAMMIQLKNRDPLLYCEWLPHVTAYCDAHHEKDALESIISYMPHVFNINECDLTL